MSYVCPKCRIVVSHAVPLPDHIPSSARCRQCQEIMIPFYPRGPIAVLAKAA